MFGDETQQCVILLITVQNMVNDGNQPFFKLLNRNMFRCQKSILKDL